MFPNVHIIEADPDDTNLIKREARNAHVLLQPADLGQLESALATSQGPTDADGLDRVSRSKKRLRI